MDELTLLKNSNTRSFYQWLLIIGLTALLVRVVTGQVLRPLANHGAVEHFAGAANLLERGMYSNGLGDSHPGSLRMPLYSFFLAGISYSDIVLLGATGFALMILKSKTIHWKLLAASFLTLIVTVVMFIAHLRNRVFLCDWILILGASYLIVVGIRWVSSTSSRFKNSGVFH